jgi:hypothetical protein
MEFEKLVDFFLFHKLTPGDYKGEVPPETPVHEINYRILVKDMFDEWIAARTEDDGEDRLLQ